MVSTGKRVKALAAITLPAALLAACADEEATIYCVDGRDQVLEDIDDCSDGRGGYYGGSGIIVVPNGGPAYSKGQVIPGNSGYTRIAPGDAAGRANAGLPPSGSIKSGTTVGGVGKGSPGVSVKSGG